VRLVTELSDAREQFQKDLLRHVARRTFVAREMERDRPHAILMGVEQLTKSFAIPALAGLDQTPLARPLIHYGAPFPKMPEIIPSNSSSGFFRPTLLINPVVKFPSHRIGRTGLGFSSISRRFFPPRAPAFGLPPINDTIASFTKRYHIIFNHLTSDQSVGNRR